LKDRVRKIFKITENKPDIILIKNSSDPYIDDNFFYYTGLDKGLFEGAIAVLFPDGNIDLIVSELESETAKKSDANIRVYKNQKDYNNILQEIISKSKNVGLNFKKISIKDFYNLNKKFSDLKFYNVSVSFEMLRLVKDEIEINLIKKACNIVDIVVDKIPDILYENMKEFELAAEMDYLMQKNGADKAAFETISSFGKNTSEPHYTHGTTVLKKGDFVLCDFGACFKKYNSDITRTFVFGKASEIQKEMYETVFEAQNQGFEKVKSGVKASDVHKVVDNYINNTKFKGKFIHSTGHSLGLSVHDGNERLSQYSELILKENMVFTIEPGIYLSGIGGVRIEDDVLIKEDGIELLTKSPRNLIEI
jgi:Xaa-Pro dipeptidase